MGVRRTAVIAYHSSPLQEPGRGDAGGMTIYVRSVARALSGLGVETDVFTRATDGLPHVAQVGPGVRAIGIEAGPPGIRKEQATQFVDQFAAGVRAFVGSEEGRYDIVHSHYWQSGLAGTSLAGAWGVPLVHSSHTLGRVKNGSLPPGDLPEPVARELAEAQVVRAADALVASTEHEWHELASLYGARNDGLRTIHPGVDHELFSPGDRKAARARLGLDPQGPVVLSVGRIQPLKGLSLAVEALARLRSLRHPPILLVVGGPSGPRGDEELVDLKKLARSLGVAEQMRWLGPRPHEGLPDIYRAADAVVVCSYSESFGFAALEAHACGVPVLGTAVGGLSYIVRDGRSGFLFDRRDPDVFAERLGAVLSNYDLRAQLGDAARRAAQRFSWHASARSLLRLYDSLLEQPMMETCVL